MEGTGMTADKLKTWMKEHKTSLNDLKNKTNQSKQKFADWFDLTNNNSTITNSHIDDFVNDNYNLIFK